MWWRQSYGFRAVWKWKCPAPSRALLLFPLRRRARRNFYRPSAHRLNTRSNDGEGEDFFFYLWGSFNCIIMIVILPTFWRSAPALKFSWQLTRNVSLVTMLVYSYRRSLDEDGRSLWVGTPSSSFTASSVAGRDAAKLPRLPGEIVFIIMKPILDPNR